MSKEQLKQEFLRKKNTYHYSVCSADGITSRDVNNFDFIIPPFSYPEHQRSQYALFKLESFYMITQGVSSPIVPAERASNSADFDLSGFYVRIDGLGIQPSLGSTIQNSAIRYGTNTFFVPNMGALSDLTQSFQYQRISGGKPADYEVACSNPVGSQVNIKVFDAEGAGELTPVGNGGFDAIINFSIELLDLD
mgnify:CR=1 FL=1|tara:strand:- start:147 stop:725 length:579 start_codon:yes stop_codon:yes gene_type:complete